MITDIGQISYFSANAYTHVAPPIDRHVEWHNGAEFCIGMQHSH